MHDSVRVNATLFVKSACVRVNNARLTVYQVNNARLCQSMPHDTMSARLRVNNARLCVSHSHITRYVSTFKSKQCTTDCVSVHCTHHTRYYSLSASAGSFGADSELPGRSMKYFSASGLTSRWTSSNSLVSKACQHSHRSENDESPAGGVSHSSAPSLYKVFSCKWC